MISVYQPVRMPKAQAEVIEKMSLKFDVNKSWLIRYLCAVGVEHCDPEKLKANKASDNTSSFRTPSALMRVRA